MNTRNLAATAAVAGLLSGGFAAKAGASDSSGSSTPLAKQAAGLNADKAAADHSCKGKNDCKGKGGCKSGDNGCKGKNSCKGKGGCSTKPKPEPKPEPKK
jgi:hypothetical protein